MTDLNYITDGFYITLISNNENGDYIWNEIAAKFDGVAKFPVHMKPSIFKQIKDAGYTIRKAYKSKAISEEELFEFISADTEQKPIRTSERMVNNALYEAFKVCLSKREFLERLDIMDTLRSLHKDVRNAERELNKVEYRYRRACKVLTEIADMNENAGEIGESKLRNIIEKSREVLND